MTGADPSGVRLTLATFNIRFWNRRDGENRWRRRRDLVAARLRRADIAGLQEARWPQLRDLRFGAAAMRWAGAGRRDGRRAGEHVPIFWKAAAFEPVDTGVFWLSSTPEAPGSRDHPEAITRMATWARLRMFAVTGQPTLLVVNTHLDHRVEAARLAGAQQVRAAVDRMAGDGPVVVTGDLNCRPGSPPYQALTDAAAGRVELTDSIDRAAVVTGPDTTLNGFEGARPGRRIDVVLVSDHWQVERHHTDDSRPAGRFPSDHFPVFVDAVLPSP